MLKKIVETVEYIHDKVALQPEIGIVLGTGLGRLAKEIEVQHELDYVHIPNFAVSTVESHSGKLIFGTLGGKQVVAMQGRFHYYEGYSMQEVTFPIRVMKMLGIKKLFLSNAAGGMNPEYEVGELMIVNDHINLFPSHPLIGPNIDELGNRFPDMSQAYDKNLIQLGLDVAAEQSIKVAQGVYVGLTGPTLETPAEYKYLRVIGGDAVGMSTVPEVIVARHMDIPCFAISIITDLGVEGKIEEVSVEKVIAVAMEKEPYLTAILKEMISRV